MKKILLIIVLFTFILFLTNCKKNNIIIEYKTINYDQDSQEIKSIKKIDDLINLVSEKVKTSCVALFCKHRGSLINNTGSGSGVIIKKDKQDYYVVTNKHVVYNETATLCDDIIIYYEGLEFKAEVVKCDDTIDLALVKFNSDINFNVCSLSEELNNGSYIICVSSPYDAKQYFNTISVGNISNTDRTFSEEINGVKVENHYFQHTASINVGSSGGGIFDLDGSLIGLNDWMVTNKNKDIERMGFGISTTLIKQAFKEYL